MMKKSTSEQDVTSVEGYFGDYGGLFVPETLMGPLEELTLFHPVGCPKCTNGYKGRVGIYEVLKVTPRIARLIMEGGNSIEIEQAAIEEGFRTLRQSALRRAGEGIISLEEANRVTKD